MSTLINSDTQYTDEATGELINNGFIYIGLDGLDAKLNPAIIYSDRGLTTVLANPQRTGSDGRSVNKIWVDGKYSMKIENSANVQKLNVLSLGELAQTGTTSLTNVQGADALTADGSPTITALENNQIYILTAAANNTGPMTLTIDLTPTWPIKKHHDNAMQANDIETGQTLAVIFNEADSVYELMTNSAIGPVDLANAQTIAGDKTFTGASSFSGKNTHAELVTLSAGANIASAATIDLTAATGNSPRITGTTATSAVTMNTGQQMLVVADGAWPLTYHATTNKLNGGVSYTCAAGDIIDYHKDLSGVVHGTISKPSLGIKSVSASVAASALTCGLAAGSLYFRSATLTDGVPVSISSGALSLVVPSGATLETVNAVQNRLYLLAINNAGTVELAVVNAAGGVNLNEEGVISTTAIGTGSDSNNVIYSTSARANVAYRVVGLVESTQATAGTWDTEPTLKQGIGGNALTAMSSLGYGQTWQDVSGSRITGTTYYNTTGKPITVVVTSLLSTATLAIIVDGLQLVTAADASVVLDSGTVIVPHGSSYSATYGGAGSTWFELR